MYNDLGGRLYNDLGGRLYNDLGGRLYDDLDGRLYNDLGLNNNTNCHPESCLLVTSEIAGSSPNLVYRFKEKNVCSPLTREDSVLWGVFVTERRRVRSQIFMVRILNSISGRQCQLIQAHHPQEGVLGTGWPIYMIYEAPFT